MIFTEQSPSDSGSYTIVAVARRQHRSLGENMICFVDLTDSEDDAPRQCAFLCTINDRFLVGEHGEQVFDSIEEITDAFSEPQREPMSGNAVTVERLIALVPHGFFDSCSHDDGDDGLIGHVKPTSLVRQLFGISGYIVVADREEFHVDFRVADLKDQEIDLDISKRHLFLHGFVKNSGCSNWHIDDQGAEDYFHFCSQLESRQLGELLACLYDIAADLMPDHRYEIVEKAPPVISDGSNPREDEGEVVCKKCGSQLRFLKTEQHVQMGQFWKQDHRAWVVCPKCGNEQTTFLQ